MKNEDVEHVTHVRPKATPIHREFKAGGGEKRVYRFANDFGAVAEREIPTDGTGYTTGLWTANIVRYFGNGPFNFAATTDSTAHHLTDDQLEHLLWTLKCKQRESVPHKRVFGSAVQRSIDK